METIRTYIGVDVGTTSARAAIFDQKGTMLASSSTPITVFKPKPDHYEHSSEEIWKSVCCSVRNIIEKSQVDVSNVRGIGFDATCSLVVLGQNDRPLSVSVTGSPEQNVIVWMDHRAIEEARFINSTQHKVLKYVGNVISPEMQTPKLLWIKRHLPNTWKNATKFMDLPDFLSYRTTGVDVRSLCCVVCKWTFQAHNKSTDNVEDSLYGWDDTYFRQIGLEDLVEEGYKRIGQRVALPGDPIEGGLTEEAAKELGLKPHTPVAVSMIDAHAGGIGTLGAPLKTTKEFVTPQMLEERMAYIAGTSACHMACSREPKFIDGVWGPYYQAMIPGMWLSEGGESAVGALIDCIIERHIQSVELKSEAEKCGLSIYELLNKKIQEMTELSNISHHSLLAKDLHVLPYFHGNRSPRADPTLRGMISGLTLTDSLPLLYLATIQSIAYGTAHIIQEMNKKGHKINTIFMSGGLTKNSLFVSETADVTQCTVILPKEPEAVLLGSAVLGSVASKDYPSILHAMNAMNQIGKIVNPTDSIVVKNYHSAKYQIFMKMYEHQLEYRKIMEKVSI